MRRLSIALLILIAAGTAPAEEPDRYDGDTLTGWATTDFAGGTPEGATLESVEGAVRLNYRRGTLSPLLHNALLTELVELRLSVRSKVAATLIIAVEDRDGAGFHHAFQVPAGEWFKLRVAPSRFKLNDDSKVKKDQLDPARLDAGYCIFDAGAITGAEGTNTIEVDDVLVKRAGVPRKEGDLVVEEGEERVITQGVRRDGNIVVKKGGTLKIRAPRFELYGDVSIEDGTLEIEGGAFIMPQRFNHERTWDLKGKSRWSIRGAEFNAGAMPFTLKLHGESAFEVVDSEFKGGVTCDGDGRPRVSLRGAKSPGEFIVAPGMSLSAVDSKGVILWLTLGANFKGRLKLPTPEHVDRWSPGCGLDVTAENCDHTYWCIISMPGSEGTIEKCEVYGAGLFFQGHSEIALKGLRNGRKIEDYALPAEDRKLRFVDCTVRAWNFYPAGKAHLTVEDCTFGEALAFGEGRIEIRNSTCDGAGGYIGTHEKSEMRVIDSTLDCLAIAHERSTLVLERCTAKGDVRATGQATVRIIAGSVGGRAEADPGATIERE